MEREHISIGPAPADEACANVGDADYWDRAVPECRRFIGLIRKKLGDEPEGARLVIKRNEHDYGTYHDVVCFYDPRKEESFAYALACERWAPKTWDDEQPFDWRSQPGEGSLLSKFMGE